MHNTIIVFTDGSSRGNPGPGGWGALIISGGMVTELAEGEESTTNNRMELSAARAALAYIESHKLEGAIEIHTDSMYLLNGSTGWMYGWEKNGWKTASGEPVLNQDIWKDLGATLFRLKQKHTIEWKKVTGHSGHRGNDRVDEIATSAADHENPLLFNGTLTEYEKMLGGSVFESLGVETIEKRSTKSTRPAFSYVSLVGGMIQIHKSWSECEARVKGKSGARFKKVFSKDEEIELVQSWTGKSEE